MTITFSQRKSDRDARTDTWIAVAGASVVIAIAVLSAGCDAPSTRVPDAGDDADVLVEDLRAAAMAELRDAQRGLFDWRFRLDPEQRVEIDGWFTELLAPQRAAVLGAARSLSRAVARADRDRSTGMDTALPLREPRRSSYREPRLRRLGRAAVELIVEQDEPSTVAVEDGDVAVGEDRELLRRACAACRFADRRGPQLVCRG